MKHAAKRKLFDNCSILAPDGICLGRCNRKKLDWYLDRGMADLVAADSIRLRFEPSGRMGADFFNTLEKPNHCVVCGGLEHLSRHHVIPHCILRYIPAEFKDHNSHDVLPLCLCCHHRYERQSDALRGILAQEVGISIQGGNTEEYRKYARIKSYAWAILTYGDKIPAERKSYLMRFISDSVGPEVDLHQIVNVDPKEQANYVTFGEAVAANIKDYNAFTQMWREHFVKVMEPQHMIEHWQVDRKWAQDWAGIRSQGPL